MAATHCRIAVKVKDSDFHKIIKGDVSKLHQPTSNDTASYIWAIPMCEYQYISIYLFWDGNPNGIGRTLLKHYNTYDNALNLCLCGNFNSLCRTNQLIHESSLITFSWEDYHPEQSNTFPCAPRAAEEFNYLFEDNEWYCFYKGEKIPLTDAIQRDIEENY